MSDEEKGEGILARKYPGNSQKGKPEKEEEERPKIEPVVTGKVIQKKTPFLKRVVETFAGDSVDNVGEFIVRDVIVPALKNLISDIASQGVERMLFGEVSRRNTTASNRTSGRYTSYSNMGDQRSGRREMSSRARATHDFRDIILDSRVEAEEVLTELDKIVKDYDVASVADLYALVDVPGTFMDNKWGWTDLSGADVRRVREGYMLILPRTTQID